MNALRIKDAGNVIILSGYYDDRERARFAECARCGVTHKLVKAGRIWSQPEHDCDANLIDAMRFEQRREEHRHDRQRNGEARRRTQVARPARAYTALRAVMAGDLS